MATFAIGDIHGWRPPLDELLAVVGPQLTATDTVVFLGDYIDRGDDTKGCIDALLAFRAAVPARVAFLAGNHEEWLLQTMVDPRRHSWLLAMNGYTTIRSYSPAAEQAIRDAAAAAGRDLLNGSVALPYEQFFEAMPLEHQEFLSSLDRYCRTDDCLCTHAGVHPSMPDLARQGKILTWGHARFPEEYAGEALIVYGHFNDPEIGADGWPRPRMVGRTIGLDTISHGVLSAVALPGPHVFQSRRYAPAIRVRD
jgi:serine/threonine protein phosphatase 1